jgi:5S rRNA maturation endonuclease (ribonuclease M5)
MIDTEKLKTIEADTVLNMLGLSYEKTGDRLMTLASYRDENTASISIQKRNGKWLWKDFGSGKGGSWIDLVMFALNLSYIDAIKFLNNIENAEICNDKKKFSFGRQEEKGLKPNGIEITAVTEIKDFELIEYLHSRAIHFIPDGLKQINYSVIKNNKTYLNSAIGIKNSSSGYALRNKKIKMNIGKSAYSLFSKDSQKQLVFVVEGMFDGLTVAEKMKDRLYDLIILNSVKNLNAFVLEILSNYKNIILALDNDESGKEAENKIISQIKSVPIYKLNFKAKDLNAALILKEKIGVTLCQL